MRKLLALAALVALPTFAADLRDVKEPARVTSIFPATAKLRVLNVWATWCVPCVAEMPDLRVIDETFGSDVALAGVSMDDMIPGDRATTKRKVVTFLDKQKIVFPNVYYTGKANALADTLNFSGEMPVTIVYDRKGKELWRHEGRLNRNETIRQIRNLLRRTR